MLWWIDGFADWAEAACPHETVYSSTYLEFLHLVRGEIRVLTVSFIKSEYMWVFYLFHIGHAGLVVTT